MSTSSTTINDQVNGVPTQKEDGGLLTGNNGGIPVHIKYSMGEHGGAESFTSEEVARKISTNTNNNLPPFAQFSKGELDMRDFVPEKVADQLYLKREKAY